MIFLQKKQPDNLVIWKVAFIFAEN